MPNIRDDLPVHESTLRDVVPFEHTSNSKDQHKRNGITHEKSDDQRSGSERPKRLASTIVTPSRLLPMEYNITIRNKDVTRSLTYSPLSKEPKATGDEQMIDALNDMEIVDQNAGGMMDCEVHDDDLLGEELMELEDRDQPGSLGVFSNIKERRHSSKTVKIG